MMEYIVENGQVFAVYATDGGAEVRYSVGLETKTLLNYQNGIVTAEYVDYMNQRIASYNGDITFECEGITEAVQATNGVATLSIEIDPGESVIVRTANVGIGNGEVFIHG